MKSIRFRSFEITPREIIASISIIAIMLLFGTLISNHMTQSRLDKNEIYNKAVKIESNDVFQYGMRTNVGNAFVNGTLSPVDTVSYPEIDGEYLYLKKVKERYTMHTRLVPYKVGEITHYRTETYWTWDYAGEESTHVEKVNFGGAEFDYGKISLPSSEYIDTIKESSHVRYKYYGTPAEDYTGTIFTTLKDGTISDDSPFYEGKSVEETYTSSLSRDWSIVFWIFWIVFTGGLVVAFYVINNRWLY